MKNRSVVFAVGDDIVNKMKKLQGELVMEFILGRIDTDYFGDHYLWIEDIGEYWRCIIDFFKEKRLSFDENQRREYILYEDKDDMIILQHKDEVKKMFTALMDTSIDEFKGFYLKRYTNTILNHDEFSTCFKGMRELCFYAANNYGYLLFCIDKA